MSDWSIGIDTGGTFTDLAAVDHTSGRLFVAKVSSTPANPADAILAALDAFVDGNGEPVGLRMLAHGTTVATNAMLESKGARAGLLITEGFRAVYPGRSGTRPKGAALIDPGYTKPEPLVPQRLTFEIPERIAFDGSVRRPLDEAAVRAAARRLRERKIEAVAICFLFSFLNPAHEEAAARILAEELPGCRISLSSRVLPVVREYPRLSTTVIDAYVGPVVQRYFEDLAERAQKRRVTRERFFIMQSHGGLMRIDLAAKYPNETLLSGPAAGIAFASALGKELGLPNIATFDMGGTSTDVSLIVSGEVSMARGGQVAGQDIGTPMIEIETLGAGGGAIASLGGDGFLKVGPQSAGAFPGPACYGLGGEAPTVTDANVVLGYVDPTRFAGGGIPGNPDIAWQTLEKLGRQLGTSAVLAAHGVRRVVNAYMQSGLRLHMTQKGCDPRDFALFAFGGAGPLHAVEVAEELGIPKIVIPPHPGISCAIGLLLSDIKHLYLQSFPASLEAADPPALEVGYAGLMERALADAGTEGFAAGELAYLRQMDLRYRHQGYELTVAAPPVLSGPADLRAIREAFDTAHRATYGMAAQDEDVEIVTLRLQSTARVPHMPLQRPRELSREPSTELPTDHRRAYFPALGGFTDTPVYRRAAFPAGAILSGPLIVEQLDSTILVGPEKVVRADKLGNLIIETK